MRWIWFLLFAITDARDKFFPKYGLYLAESESNSTFVELGEDECSLTLTYLFPTTMKTIEETTSCPLSENQKKVLRNDIESVQKTVKNEIKQIFGLHGQEVFVSTTLKPDFITRGCNKPHVSGFAWEHLPMHTQMSGCILFPVSTQAALATYSEAKNFCSNLGGSLTSIGYVESTGLKIFIRALHQRYHVHKSWVLDTIDTRPLKDGIQYVYDVSATKEFSQEFSHNRHPFSCVLKHAHNGGDKTRPTTSTNANRPGTTNPPLAPPLDRPIINRPPPNYYDDYEFTTTTIKTIVTTTTTNAATTTFKEDFSKPSHNFLFSKAYFNNLNKSWTQTFAATKLPAFSFDANTLCDAYNVTQRVEITLEAEIPIGMDYPMNIVEVFSVGEKDDIYNILNGRLSYKRISSTDIIERPIGLRQLDNSWLYFDVPRKGSPITAMNVTLQLVANSCKADIMLLGKLGTFDEKRKKRDISFLDYWLSGGSMTPFSINRAVHDLAKLEDVKLMHLRSQMASKGEVMALVHDVSDLKSELDKRLCETQEDLRTERLTERLIDHLWQTFRKLKTDINACGRGEVPDSVNNAQLQKLCQAANPNHRLCNSLAYLRRLFKCKVQGTEFDKIHAGHVVGNITLSIIKIDNDEKQIYEVYNSPVPVSSNLHNVDIKKNPRHPSSTIISRVRRNRYSSFNYLRLSNLPRLLLVSPDGLLRSLDRCQNHNELRLCSTFQTSDNDCIHNIFNGNVNKIPLACSRQRHSYDNCVVTSTHRGYMLSTHIAKDLTRRNVGIFEPAKESCGEMNVCLITTPGTSFHCGHTYNVKPNRRLKAVKIDTVKDGLSIVNISMGRTNDDKLHTRLTALETELASDRQIDIKDNDLPLVQLIRQVQPDHLSHAKIAGYGILVFGCLLAIGALLYKTRQWLTLWRKHRNEKTLEETKNLAAEMEKLRDALGS